jgi:hypothetical protein
VLRGWFRDDRNPAGVHGKAYRCALLCSVMVQFKLKFVTITSGRGLRGATPDFANGLEKVHAQRCFEYLRKVNYSPQVPRPANARAEDSEKEAFKKVSR